jgi:hypothetical protein
MQKKGLVVLLAALLAGVFLIPYELCGQDVEQGDTRISVPPPTGYRGQITGEDLLSALKRYFPEVRIWGVVDDIYWTVTKEEMECFLATDKTDKMFVGRSYDEYEYLDIDDYAFALLGNMSHDFGWERVPFGIIGKGQRHYNRPDEMVLHNIFATIEGGRVVLYEINPMTDEMEKITFKQRNVLFALI